MPSASTSPGSPTKQPCAFLPTLEAALPPTARPHWGKVFTLDAAEVRERYPRFDDFAALAARFDPERRSVNGFLSGSALSGARSTPALAFPKLLPVTSESDARRILIGCHAVDDDRRPASRGGERMNSFDGPTRPDVDPERRHAL